MPNQLSFRLASASHDELETLSTFLQQAAGQPMEVVIDGERPLPAAAVQLLLAAQVGSPDRSLLRLISGSDRVRDGLRLLGVDHVLIVGE